MLTTVYTNPAKGGRAYYAGMTPEVAATLVAELEDAARRYCDLMDAAGRAVPHIRLTERQRQALDRHYPHDGQAHLRDTFHGIPYRTVP